MTKLAFLETETQSDLKDIGLYNLTAPLLQRAFPSSHQVKRSVQAIINLIFTSLSRLCLTTMEVSYAYPTMSHPRTSSNSSSSGYYYKHIWLITGPAGCGKSTVANYIAASLHLPYLEGDDVRLSLSHSCRIILTNYSTTAPRMSTR